MRLLPREEHFFELFKGVAARTHEAAGHLYDMFSVGPERVRTIRKQVIAHLSIGGNTPDLPYCLLLMSLVKDVERIGDYAKNLSEVNEIHQDPLPTDDITAELREIRSGIESAFAATWDVFSTSARERAVGMIQQGRDLTHRCDVLIERIAHSDYNASAAVAIVLATRYYKRVAAHVLNVLSSVVMPLHKLDYYDEREVAAAKEGNP